MAPARARNPRVSNDFCLLAIFANGAVIESDLLKITAYSLQTWDKTPTARYLIELETCCQKLAYHPALGRRSDYIRPGLRRMENCSHVLFYRQQQDGIRICSILHQCMLPKNHPGDDRDDPS